MDDEVDPDLAWMPLQGTPYWENIAGRAVGYRTVAEMAERSGRDCMPASRVQAIQANDDWLREVVTGEYLPKWHPVDGSPLFRRVIPSTVGWRNIGPKPVGYRYTPIFDHRTPDECAVGTVVEAEEEGMWLRVASGLYLPLVHPVSRNPLFARVRDD